MHTHMHAHTHSQPSVSPCQGAISRPDRMTLPRVPGWQPGPGIPGVLIGHTHSFSFSLQTLSWPLSVPVRNTRHTPVQILDMEKLAVWPWATRLSSLSLGLPNHTKRIITYLTGQVTEPPIKSTPPCPSYTHLPPQLAGIIFEDGDSILLPGSPEHGLK